MRKTKMVFLFVFFMLGLSYLTVSAAPFNKPNGISMSIDRFISDYTGVKSFKISSFSGREGVRDETVILNHVFYESDTHKVSFSASIDRGGVTFDASGVLYNSYKQDDDINSVVGCIESTNEDITVLHFEVYNSNTTDIFYARNDYKNRPHLKLYFCLDDKLYLFETEIPDNLKAIVLERTKENQCDNMIYDGFWFANIVQADVEVIPSGEKTTEHNQAYTFQYRYTVAGAEYYQYCTVLVIWKISNVSVHYQISFDVMYGATLIQHKAITSGPVSYYCSVGN